jgi:diphthamide biosynthesis protein 4
MADLYAVFSVPKHASPAQIKSAYHRLLLQSHPDKRPICDTSIPADIDLIKEAYATLSNPERRAAYDARLDGQRKHGSQTVPRPAQVVSLEDFQEDHPSDEDRQGPWSYPCRCGGSYTISTALMEEGKHLVACSTCSEVIWVGYEQVDVDD